MKVNLKCFADLSERYECRYDEKTNVEMPEGTTVKSFIMNYGIPYETVKVSFVNGVISDANYQLRDGDDLTLVPAVGGM